MVGRRYAVIVALVAFVVSGVALVRADPVTLPKPVKVELAAKEGKKVTRGLLISYDDDIATVKIGDAEQQLNWTDIDAGSAYQARVKLIDRKVAQDWFGLGAFAWRMGAEKQSRAAFDQAVKLQADLRAEADKILASPAGPKTPPVKDDAKGNPKDDTVAPPPGDAPPAQPGRDDDSKDGKVTKFLPATEEQAARAMAAARKAAQGVEEEIGVKLADFETDHFLVFTDWDPAEYKFLKDNVEGAYRCVAKQFDMDPRQNVFVGKLPIYMFSKKEDFQKYSLTFDHFPTTDLVLGYYHGNTSGVGHMVMWKPETRNGKTLAEAEKLWAYVLTHEFTHAFVARYRTNAQIPRWMNEGIAEVIAGSQFPKPENRRWARFMAQKDADVSFLFNDKQMPAGEYYPVMMTMVEVLVVDDRKAFLKTFNDIKDGVDPKDALKINFKLDYDGLVKAWRRYAKGLR